MADIQGVPENLRVERGIAFDSVMIAASTIAIVVRIWSRVVMSSVENQQWGWDDYFAILSWPFVVSLPILGLVLNALNDLAARNPLMSLDSITLGLKFFYVGQLAIILAVIVPKYSVLCFYNRVLKITSSSVRYLFWLAVALNTGYLISDFFAVSLMCQPVQKIWLPLTSGTCINVFPFFLSKAIINVIIDLLILWLPMPILWKLHLSPAKKLRLIGFFICGYAVLILSIGSLATTASFSNTFDNDPFGTAIPLAYWTTSEASILLISICLPNAFSLVQRARQHGPKALFTRRVFTTDSQVRLMTRSNGSGSADKRSFARKVNVESTINMSGTDLGSRGSHSF